MQGIGLLVRKGVGLASITIEVKQFEAPPKAPNTSTDPVTHIEITQTASGLKSTQENRCVDDTFREHDDWLFGNVKGKSKWLKLDEIEDVYLSDNWDADNEQFLWSHVESLGNGWTADQIWGFQTIDGERRYCRNILITKDDERAEFRFVYDFEA